MSILSYGRVYLGMTAAEVMDCTPRYFEALCKRYREEIERAEWQQEFMLAQLASVVANFSFGGCKPPTSPKDFMPSEWVKTAPKTKKRTRKKSKKQFGEELRKAMMAAFGTG